MYAPQIRRQALTQVAMKAVGMEERFALYSQSPRFRTSRVQEKSMKHGREREGEMLLSPNLLSGQKEREREVQIRCDRSVR